MTIWKEEEKRGRLGLVVTTVIKETKARYVFKLEEAQDCVFALALVNDNERDLSLIEFSNLRV